MIDPTFFSAIADFIGALLNAILVSSIEDLSGTHHAHELLKQVIAA